MKNEENNLEFDIINELYLGNNYHLTPQFWNTTRFHWLDSEEFNPKKAIVRTIEKEEYKNKKVFINTILEKTDRINLYKIQVDPKSMFEMFENTKISSTILFTTEEPVKYLDVTLNNYDEFEVSDQTPKQCFPLFELLNAGFHFISKEFTRYGRRI